MAQADAIKTPLLILHGDRDRRTGFVQSEMLYRLSNVAGRRRVGALDRGANHDLSRTGPWWIEWID